MRKYLSVILLCLAAVLSLVLDVAYQPQTGDTCAFCISDSGQGSGIECRDCLVWESGLPANSAIETVKAEGSVFSFLRHITRVPFGGHVSRLRLSAIYRNLLACRAIVLHKCFNGSHFLHQICVLRN